MGCGLDSNWPIIGIPCVLGQDGLKDHGGELWKFITQDKIQFNKCFGSIICMTPT
jgi:hypothetical protein